MVSVSFVGDCFLIIKYSNLMEELRGKSFRLLRWRLFSYADEIHNRENKLAEFPSPSLETVFLCKKRKCMGQEKRPRFRLLRWRLFSYVMKIRAHKRIYEVTFPSPSLETVFLSKTWLEMRKRPLNFSFRLLRWRLFSYYMDR